MFSIKDRIARMRASLKGEFTKEDCKVVQHDTADVSDILQKSGLSKKKYLIATSGYSFDQEGYADTTLKFLKQLDKYLRPGNAGYITPPTLYSGSIYNMTTEVSGLKPGNVAFFTTQRYWEGTDLDAFDIYINRTTATATATACPHQEGFKVNSRFFSGYSTIGLSSSRIGSSSISADNGVIEKVSNA